MIEKGGDCQYCRSSGAGKTTLLQIMGTLDMPDGGSVVIDGTQVSRMKEKEFSAFRNHHIGFVFQFHQLLPEFTALENVMIPAFIAGRGQQEAKEGGYGNLVSWGLPNVLPTNRMSCREVRSNVWRWPVLSSIIQQWCWQMNLPAAWILIIRRTAPALFDLRNRFGQTFVIVTHDEGLAQLTDRTIHLIDGEINKMV